jgi:large repetitive protein
VAQLVARAGAQRYPSVAADSAGNFVVVWQSLGSSGTDSDDASIHGRRFAANGVPLGGEAQINSYTTSIQELPVVAAADGGDFVVAWTSVGSFGTDSSYSSIQAQRFGCVFCDGFESGDTANWWAAS